MMGCYCWGLGGEFGTVPPYTSRRVESSPEEYEQGAFAFRRRQTLDSGLQPRSTSMSLESDFAVCADTP